MESAIVGIGREKRRFGGLGRKRGWEERRGEGERGVLGERG